jgi:hypothetical protein
MGWGAPGYGGPPVRPTGVTLAAIFLIVMGVLYALFGAACGVFGSAATTINDQGTGIAGFVGGGLLVFGLIVLVLGILQIAAGAGSLSGRGWARWTGIIISIIFAVLSILGALTAMTAENGIAGGAGGLVVGVLYALTAWALIQANAFFASSR